MLILSSEYGKLLTRLDALGVFRMANVESGKGYKKGQNVVELLSSLFGLQTGNWGPGSHYGNDGLLLIYWLR